MSDDPEYDDDNPPPRARKKSGGGKWLVIILGILGVGGLVCCGGVVYLGMQLAPNMTPASVTKKAQEIAPITIPEGWTPLMAMNLWVAEMVMYAADGNPDNGMLMLIEVTGDQAQGKMMAEQQMQQQSKTQRMKVEETTTKTFNLRGKDYSFEFAKGKSDSGEEMHMVTGELPPSKPGKVVVLMIIQKGDKYDEESIIEMIESIK